MRPQLDHQPHDQGAIRARGRTSSPGQNVRHRLLVEDARLLRRVRARIQRGARQDASADDRRSARQPAADHAWCLWRRRHGFDRPRPVHAHDPPQHRLHLHHRRQRDVRAHQRPVLGDRRPRLGTEEGRGQHLPAHRPLRGRVDAWLLVHRPLFQRRRQAGRPAHQGCDRPPRNGDPRHHLAVRHVQ